MTSNTTDVMERRRIVADALLSLPAPAEVS